jgi:agmatine deiminase
MKDRHTIPKASGYYQAAEWEAHESTWLQWPHDKIYAGYQMNLGRIWLEMTAALGLHETVHIIAKDEQHLEHIAYLLHFFGLDSQNIDLRVIPTDDVWARDNGLIFVVNNKGDMAITDWNFNGWGERFNHPLDAQVSASLAKQLAMPLFVPPLVMEGGALSVNGAGAFMVTDSSIINDNRNPGLSKEEIEEVLQEYLGVCHFIWLSGAGQVECEKWGDMTDSHVDIVAHFTAESTVLYNWTEDKSDPRYPMFVKAYQELQEATTQSGKSLTLVALPTPADGVHQVTNLAPWRVATLTDGVYSNYYTANKVVLVPVYGNVNDDRARGIIGEQVPGREIIGSDAISLIEDGGAIGCVTQSQPDRRYKQNGHRTYTGH